MYYSSKTYLKKDYISLITMKKVVAILLIPIFLLMTSGLAITSLYCSGKISKVGLKVNACCKDVNKGGCCKTKTTIVKLDDAFVSGTSASFDLHKIIDYYVPAFYLDIGHVSIQKVAVMEHWDKAPPPVKGELYLLFRSLII